MVEDAGFVKVCLEEIVNLNTLGMCAEKTCSRPYSHFVMVKLNGLELNIGFCQSHGIQFEEAGYNHFWKQSQEDFLEGKLPKIDLNQEVLE